MYRKFLMMAVGFSLMGRGFLLWAQDDDSLQAPMQDAMEEEQRSSEVAEKITELKGRLNGLEESYLETKGTVDKLKKIKVSGYIQTQARMAVNYDEATADTSHSHRPSPGMYGYNVGDFAGGKFGDFMSSVFQVRRGHIKVAYEAELSQGVLQLDVMPFSTLSLVDAVTTTTTLDTIYDTLGVRHIVTRNVSTTSSKKTALAGGGVSVKDVYLRFSEPWLKSIALKAGIFDRPFGFEISYSSSARESPERSRIFQTLFPGELDMGVSLEYLPADELPLWAQHFNFKGGVFNGNGINWEVDKYRDFIGRLGVALPFTEINMAIDAGVSAYLGKVEARNDTVMTFVAGSKTFVHNGAYKKFDAIDRKYYGGDLQLYLDLPVIGGLSLRTEYLKGQQPGQIDNVCSPKSDIASTKPWYIRNFSGYYFMWVQNLWRYNQFVIKYDSFDPNTDVAGNDITSPTELSYNTLGLGLIHHWDQNVKLMLYYDHIVNETSTALTGSKDMYQKDLFDDVLTFRIQYKF